MRIVGILVVGTCLATSCHALMGWLGEYDDIVPQYNATGSHKGPGSSSSHSHHHGSSSNHHNHGSMSSPHQHKDSTTSGGKSSGSHQHHKKAPSDSELKMSHGHDHGSQESPHKHHHHNSPAIDHGSLESPHKHHQHNSPAMDHTQTGHKQTEDQEQNKPHKHDHEITSSRHAHWPPRHGLHHHGSKRKHAFAFSPYKHHMHHGHHTSEDEGRDVIQERPILQHQGWGDVSYPYPDSSYDDELGDSESGHHHHGGSNFHNHHNEPFHHAHPSHHGSGHEHTGHSTPSHLPPCPMLYTRIGQRCIAIFSIAQVSWWDANSFCDSIFGELFTFSGIQDYFEFLNYLQISGASSDLWIGGKSEGRSWKWVNRSPMPLGSPYWAIRNNYFPSWSRDEDVYSQAPTPTASFGLGVYKPRCASMSSKYFYYLSDENCDDKMSPVCVLRDDAEVVVLKVWAEGGKIPIEGVTVMPPPLTPGTPTEPFEIPEEGSGIDASLEGSGDAIWFDGLSFDSEKDD